VETLLKTSCALASTIKSNGEIHNRRHNVLEAGRCPDKVNVHDSADDEDIYIDCTVNYYEDMETSLEQSAGEYEPSLNSFLAERESNEQRTDAPLTQFVGLPSFMIYQGTITTFFMRNFIFFIVYLGNV
jgi:hypothetical protein